MTAAPHDPLIGATVDDRYLVLSKVARGGMSTVYLAKDVRLNRNIALKILHPHLATDNAFIERLQREAWSAASLSHPHVVQIHDHGAGASHAYLVLEYIDGHTLRDVIAQEGALTPRRALDLFDPIVEGLAAAHAAGLVHRDVKPENVLISRTGWVKIGDFGLSRAVTTTTNTGTLLGTVGYIAPELVNGQGGDARSDIYSAGIMLYELLTGAQPFLGQVPIAVAMAHVRDRVPAPSAAVPGLPPEMDELVGYMTEKDPEHRPMNGAALLEDLRHIRASLTPAALDSGGAARAPHRPAPPSPPTVRPTVGAADTVFVPGAGADTGPATTVLARPASPPATPYQPTSVLPARSRLSVDAANATTGLDPLPLAVQPRPSKRQARADAKRRAKQAARPTRVLGSRHPRRRAALWVSLVVFLAVLAAAAGWFLALGPGALATVPDVRSQTVAEAQALISAQGFATVTTTEVFDEEVEAGRIVATDPIGGTELRRFLDVTLRVSAGPVLYPVPNITGQLLADATTALAAGPLMLGTVTEAYNEEQPVGMILAQDPAVGSPFRAGTPINVTVSRGPQPIPVPSVVGLYRNAAETALDAVALTSVVAAEQVHSATVPAGVVLSQSPSTGTLTAGETVTLTLSLGPKMVMVPDLVGKQVAAATAELTALGLTVKVDEILGGFFGTVRAQTPQGVEVVEGSTVTLTVV